MDKISQCSLPLFLVLWNQRQGQRTPKIHLRMAEFLERAWTEQNTRLLLMAFRSAGKSTVAGIFAAWLLFRNADLRILVLAADQSLAKKMVRNVKRIVERHPLTAHLKPANPDQWAADRFTVGRTLELRDPSMLACGLGGNITGSRADVVICDDVEVPATCDSAEKREQLRARLAEMAYVLTPGGTQLYLGTPHHYHSIYADAPRADLGEEAEFLRGFTRFMLPIVNEDGESQWPERFTAEDIERLKIATGPNKFESQMMLRPVNIAESRLDPAALRLYDTPLDYTRELGALFIGEKKMVAAAAHGRADNAMGSLQLRCHPGRPAGTHQSPWRTLGAHRDDAAGNSGGGRRASPQRSTVARTNCAAFDQRSSLGGGRIVIPRPRGGDPSSARSLGRFPIRRGGRCARWPAHLAGTGRRAR